MSTPTPANGSVPLHPALADMRDILLPPAISDMPPLWLIGSLLLGLLTLIGLGLWLWRRHTRRGAWYQAARLGLARVRTTLHGSPEDYATLNRLLKRTAEAAGYPQCLSLSGDAWANWLHQHAPQYARQDWQQFVEGAWRPASDLNAEQAMDMASAVCEHLRRLPGGTRTC